MANKKMILIAEDEKPMAKTLKAKLEASGFGAEIAENGEIAMEYLAKKNFDLLLLDLMMPKKDGFFVLEQLKKTGNKIPVIISSNLSQESDIEQVKKFGVKDYFVKSNIQINEVVDHIKKVLGI